MRRQTPTGSITETRIILRVILRMTSTSDILVSALISMVFNIEQLLFINILFLLFFSYYKIFCKSFEN